jgi:hypothetical protein
MIVSGVCIPSRFNSFLIVIAIFILLVSLESGFCSMCQGFPDGNLCAVGFYSYRIKNQLGFFFLFLKKKSVKMNLKDYLLHFLNLNPKQVSCILDVYRRHPGVSSNEKKKLVLSVIKGKHRIKDLEIKFKEMFSKAEENGNVLIEMMDAGLFQPSLTIAEIIPWMEEEPRQNIREQLWFLLFARKCQSLQIHQMTMPMFFCLFPPGLESTLQYREDIILCFMIEMSNLVHLKFPDMFHYFSALLPRESRNRNTTIWILFIEWIRRGIVPFADLLRTASEADLDHDDRSKLLYQMINEYLDTISSTRAMNPGAVDNPVPDYAAIEPYLTQQFLLPDPLAQLQVKLRRRVLNMEE